MLLKKKKNLDPKPFLTLIEMRIGQVRKPKLFNPHR